MITRYECPVGSCKWTRDDPGPDASEGAGETIEEAAASAVRAYLLRTEAAIREHLETHPLPEWAQEVMRLRGELDREKRDAGIVGASLLRRLGGSAFVSDSEMSGGSGTLLRTQVANGFVLDVVP